jgi:hypothetical protein
MLNAPGLRAVIGFGLLIGSAAATALVTPGVNFWPLLALLIAGWLVSVQLTAKYRHKYPQRYTTYLLASHLKAALVAAPIVGLSWLIFRPASVAAENLWTAFLVFSLLDLIVSSFRRREDKARTCPSSRPPRNVRPAR